MRSSFWWRSTLINLGMTISNTKCAIRIAFILIALLFARWIGGYVPSFSILQPTFTYFSNITQFILVTDRSNSNKPFMDSFTPRDRETNHNAVCVWFLYLKSLSIKWVTTFLTRAIKLCNFKFAFMTNVCDIKFILYFTSFTYISVEESELRATTKYKFYKINTPR